MSPNLEQIAIETAEKILGIDGVLTTYRCAGIGHGADEQVAIQILTALRAAQDTKPSDLSASNEASGRDSARLVGAHTPTPWRTIILSREIEHEKPNQFTYPIKPVGGNFLIANVTLAYPVKDGDPRVLDYAQGEANAAFIVRACNSHAELVGHLEIAAQRFDLLADGYDQRGQKPFAEHLRKYATEARSAIDAAAGREKP